MDGCSLPLRSALVSSRPSPENVNTETHATVIVRVVACTCVCHVEGWREALGAESRVLDGDSWVHGGGD